MFRTRIKELREKAGYTSQQAFADAFGVGQSTVGGWETGTRHPKHETMIRLAEFFHTTLDDLEGTPSTQPKEIVEALSNAESSLLSRFRQLNAVGQERLLEQAYFYAETKKYQVSHGAKIAVKESQ